jgi:hypothetical protein
LIAGAASRSFSYVINTQPAIWRSDFLSDKELIAKTSILSPLHQDNGSVQLDFFSRRNPGVAPASLLANLKYGTLGNK